MTGNDIILCVHMNIVFKAACFVYRENTQTGSQKGESGGTDGFQMSLWPPLISLLKNYEDLGYWLNVRAHVLIKHTRGDMLAVKCRQK